MKTYNFGVTGKERKALVAAMSEILGAEYKYRGVPTMAFEVGGYEVLRDGTVVGEDNIGLIARLEEQGFCLNGSSETEQADETPETGAENAEMSDGAEETKQADETPEISEETADTGEIAEQADEPTQGETTANEGADGTENADEPQEGEELAVESQEGEDGENAADTAINLVIEYPLEGITDEILNNIRKLVAAKAPLIKTALGVDELPIFLTNTTLKFPWFENTDPHDAQDYAKFICALCETAKRKKRVTASVIDTDNPRFSMRVWLISLGMIGDEFSKIRQLMMANLEGDSGWRFGNPRKANAEKKSQPADIAPEVPLIREMVQETPETGTENGETAE